VWRAREQDLSRAPRFDCAALPRLEIEGVEETDGDALIVYGVLRCVDGACGARFPIIDGVPMIVANVRDLIERDGDALLRRTDLPEGVEGFIAAAMGPGGKFDRARLYTGAYAWDHYGSGGGAGGEGGDAVRVLRRLVEMGGGLGVGSEVGGVGGVIDAGCATGGVSLELGAMVGEASDRALVLGVDMHLGMLRVAQSALRTGEVVYPLRREGLVYDRVRVAVDARRMAHAGRVDFWCCDAMALPIASASVDACVTLHTLDAVASPAGLLAELSRVTRDKGRVLLASPFDWTQSVTAMENWLGGHSEHAPHRGEGASVLEMLLSGGASGIELGGSGIDRLRVIARGDMEWRVRLYARAMTHYRTHMIACEVREPMA
jgi:SAM-dependent methyltransferase